MCYESASGYVPIDNAGCCWGYGIALSYPYPIIQVCEDSDSLFTPVLNKGFLDFCENKGGGRQTELENWKHKTLPFPLYCPAETKKLLVGWKYVHVVIPWFIVKLEKPIIRWENVTHCPNVFIFEHGDLQVLINLSEIQEQPFLATILNYPRLITWTSDWFLSVTQPAESNSMICSETKIFSSKVEFWFFISFQWMGGHNCPL